METPQIKNKFGYWLRTSITARMIMVGFLTLILLIPLSFIDELILERSLRQKDVVNEINEKWGNEVLVYGPILKLPYKTYTETSTFNKKTKSYFKETKTNINHAYIFPEKLDADIIADSKTLKRGNYASAVFTTKIHFSGELIIPSLVNKDIMPEDILWNKASIIIRTSNLKGITDEVKLKMNGQLYTLETNFRNGLPQRYLNDLETGFLHLENHRPLSFEVSMVYNGSKSVKITPVGKTTTMAMASNWQDPSFTGNYLPNDKTKRINASGFKADWKVLHINRAFSQLHLNNIPDLTEFSFGTKFVVMVDEYQKSERSAKYGFLVIGLTFLVFFLIQTLSKINIHPFQYFMIGLALTMFYTLLVSISEHSNFLKAYLIAGTSVVVLISLYSKSILKNFKFPIFIGLSLTALYSFIYIIIQLENYALLVGSIGLFLILAIVMFVSRKIDWSNN